MLISLSCKIGEQVWWSFGSTNIRLLAALIGKESYAGSDKYHLPMLVKEREPLWYWIP